jgi:hypothetical protein
MVYKLIMDKIEYKGFYCTVEKTDTGYKGTIEGVDLPPVVGRTTTKFTLVFHSLIDSHLGQ